MSKKHREIIVWISGALLITAYILHLAGVALVRDSALIVATIIAGYPIAKKAWQSARMKTFSIELLVTIAVVGALFIGEYVESAAVTFLFLFGAYLEARTLEKTRTALKSLVDLAPLEATVLRDGTAVTIPVDEVQVGDRIRIQSGEKIAIDGTVVVGNAFINEAAITGESVPAHKKIDDRVYSGTIIDNGYIEVIAEKVGDDTAFAKIIELVEEAQETKAKTQKFLERFAAKYTPAILILSVIVYAFTRDIEMTLTFLVIACPGALVISAPVSIVAGIGNGAKHGVLIKGGEMMEKLAKADIVVFDKTGTLTKGKPSVTAIHTFGMDEADVLRLSAEAEIVSEHHLGQTIVQEARNRGIELRSTPTDVHVVKGHGIKATIEQHAIAIGNRKWMAHEHIDLSTDIDTYAIAQEKEGNTAVFIAIDGVMAGVISIADQIRSEAAHAVSQLKQNGIKQVVMLTGDNAHTAAKVAAQLGIDRVHAELLPEHKVEHIQALKAKGHRVAMIGDGINDAPAIATADIGLAMGGSGTDVAMETADVVIMADRLDRLVHGYTLAKATVRNMKQNMFFAVAVVFVLLAGVVTKNIFLASGMLIHELSVLLVILNALRLVRYNKDNKRKRKGVSHDVLRAS